MKKPKLYHILLEFAPNTIPKEKQFAIENTYPIEASREQSDYL
jgi:hypothetical protein